jgi:hypothetical protein
MSAILGLLGTEQFATERFKNIRRSVFYFYPNGTAPLTGILSLLKEEMTNDPEFQHYEKRMLEQKSTTLTTGLSPAGPFMTVAGAAKADGFSPVAGEAIRVKVASTDNFRAGHILQISPVPNAAASANFTLRMLVTAIVSTTVVEGTWLEAYTSIGNDTDANSLEVLVIGSAHQEGAVGAALAPYNLPMSVSNYTQIFRTPFRITGTALKTSAKFDETGPYKDKAKEASIYHMIEIEKGILFGVKTKTVDGATSLPTYTTGGILYHLQQWEAGTVYGNTAATLDSDDTKRIIENASGNMSEKAYDGYLERVFRVTNNVANEKLVLCGSGFLNTINQLYKNKSVLNTNLPMTATYGMDIVQHRTPFGTIYYKTHPLFSQNSSMRYNALFLDIQNIEYRYLDGRDTELLKNRQPNNADYREDEWFSDCGLELRFPESHMYLKNVQNYIP